MRRPSPMISPIRMRGLSDAYGSWKMICILRRISRIADPDRDDSSRPSKVMVPRVCSLSRTRQRPRVVLPQPDSPTRPTVSPSSTSRLTPSTALTCSRAPPSSPVRTGKYFFRSLISSSGILRNLEAGDAMVCLDLDQRRLRLRTCGVGAHATVAEMAARRPIERIRDHSRNRLQSLLRSAAARHRIQQPDRVGMHRAGEDDFWFRPFHDLAGVHDRHLVGAFRDDTQIVRDEQDRHAEPLLELADQLPYLRLDRDVERGRRFIGDEELGSAGERHRDHDSLTLPAGKLVRITSYPLPGLGDLDQAKHLDRALTCLASAGALMQPHGFRDLIADGHDGVERGHRLLEDHRDLVAADTPHLLPWEAGEILSTIQDLSADDAAGSLGEQLDDRKCGHTLAAAGLADQPDRFAILDVEGDAIDRAYLAVAREERGAQILDPQERRHSEFRRYPIPVAAPGARFILPGGGSRARVVGSMGPRE